MLFSLLESVVTRVMRIISNLMRFVHVRSLFTNKDDDNNGNNNLRRWGKVGKEEKDEKKNGERSVGEARAINSANTWLRCNFDKIHKLRNIIKNASLLLCHFTPHKNVFSQYIIRQVLLSCT